MEHFTMIAKDVVRHVLSKQFQEDIIFLALRTETRPAVSPNELIYCAGTKGEGRCRGKRKEFCDRLEYFGSELLKRRESGVGEWVDGCWGRHFRDDDD
jgi:hypothetical protein